MAPPTAVIFDLDGTLVDSLVDIASACNVALGEEGLPSVPVGRIRNFVGGGLRRLAVQAVEAVSAAAADGQPSPASRSSRLVEAVHRRIEQVYAEHPIDQARPFPGIAATLNRLATHGVPMAVLSNKPHAASLQVVAALFPGMPFVRVQGFPTDGAAKPHPRHAIAIAHLMRCRPHQMALVGDGEHDIECARRAGIQAIGVAWGYRSPRQLMGSGASHLVDHPYRVARLLAPS